MLKFRRMPLRWQLTMLITLISSLTLGVAFISYFVLQVRYLKDEVEINAYAVRKPFLKRVTQTMMTLPAQSLGEGGESNQKIFGLQDLAANNAVIAAGVLTPQERLLELYVNPAFKN